MRLGQLARKLSMRPTEIVTFLAKQSIQIENNGNARIEDEHVKMILEKYAPNQKFEQVTIDELVEAPVVEEKIDAVISELDVIEPKAPSSTLAEEKIEVIKAPKVELSGLKVLGKIELPEPKKKEVPLVELGAEETNPIEATVSQEQPSPRPRQERKPYPQRKDQRSNTSPRPQKNPVEIQREREAKEAEEKRRQAQEQSKEKRALHYLKKVNTKQPTVKATKVIDEPSERQVVIAKPAPKTAFGKFVRWLTSSR